MSAKVTLESSQTMDYATTVKSHSQFQLAFHVPVVANKEIFQYDLYKGSTFHVQSSFQLENCMRC